MLRAGMAFEDEAVLGDCLSRPPNSPSVTKASPEYQQSKRHALSFFLKGVVSSGEKWS